MIVVFLFNGTDTQMEKKSLTIMNLQQSDATCYVQWLDVVRECVLSRIVSSMMLHPPCWTSMFRLFYLT